jgi:hypothetical protein
MFALPLELNVSQKDLENIIKWLSEGGHRTTSWFWKQVNFSSQTAPLRKPKMEWLVTGLG